MSGLSVLSAGPGIALQDLGRPGRLASGLTRGGAADVLALHEGAALLGQCADSAALEMVGLGGRFEALSDVLIALTGAEMRASCNGAPLTWNASHTIPSGACLELGAVTVGTYAYLHIAGGFQTPLYLGSRATHLSAGLGHKLGTGDLLPASAKSSGSRVLPRDKRFDGGHVRIVPSMQTDQFPADIIERFTSTTFRRDPRANRQGMRLDFDGPGFDTSHARSLVSEIVTPGDVQITGDGTPFVLLAECQTTGGYPRIGTVLPSDLPRVVQTPAGKALTFEFVRIDEAREIEARARKVWASLPKAVRPLVRDPHDMDDLMAFNLISGAITGE